MLLRELVGGDPPAACQLIYINDPTGFGHRVVDGDRVLEQVFTQFADFEAGVAELHAQGYVETERSLTRRVFVTSDRFWIVAIEGDRLHTQFGGIRVNWRASSGTTKSKEFRDRDRAVAAYHHAIAVKRDEGYHEMLGRKVVLVGGAGLPKKPGKRKAR